MASTTAIAAAGDDERRPELRLWLKAEGSGSADADFSLVAYGSRADLLYCAASLTDALLRQCDAEPEHFFAMIEMLREAKRRSGGI